MIRYHKNIVDDINMLSGNERKIVMDFINKIKENPFKISEGGLGKVAVESEFEKMMSVKADDTGIHIVYKIINSKKSNSILLIFVSVVSDSASNLF